MKLTRVSSLVLVYDYFGSLPARYWIKNSKVIAFLKPTTNIEGFNYIIISKFGYDILTFLLSIPEVELVTGWSSLKQRKTTIHKSRILALKKKRK